MDSTVRFSDIHVIESLPERQYSLRTGKHLYEALEPYGIASKPPVCVLYHEVEDSTDLWSLLAEIREQAARGRGPLLHFETHGGARPEEPSRAATSQGIVLASGELIEWRRLAPVLTSINVQTRLNLVVFVAACNGVDIASIAQASERAPMRLLVGPNRVVTFAEISEATQAFYTTLFSEGDGASAVRAMNTAVSGDEATFVPIGVEELFRETLTQFIRLKGNPDEVGRRTEAIVQHLHNEAGWPLDYLEKPRQQIRDYLGDHALHFQTMKRRFFMVDLFPDHSRRFDLRLEDCS